MSNAVFGKTLENMKKTWKYYTFHNREKKLFGVITKLLYYKVFHRMSISSRNEKTQIVMNKPVYLALSVLELSKILMFEFRYD